MGSQSDIETNNQSVKHSEEWFAENERPSRQSLYQLAESGTPEAMETLQNLAEKYDITNYDDPDNMTALADKIAQAIESPESIDGGL